LNSPLNKAGFLSIDIHTINDVVIRVNPKVRIPKNFNRFIGLIEQLFKFKKVPPKKEYLLKIEEIRLDELIRSYKGSEFFILSEHGKPYNREKMFKVFRGNKSVVLLIGAFHRGEFGKQIEKLTPNKIKIDSETLDSAIVVSAIINAYEYAINLDKMRMNLS